MSSFIQEFKNFAVKGNAMDMAVGVIIGAAFGKIVSSIVNDILMPPIGWLIGGVDFTDLKITLPMEEIAGIKMTAATIKYGNFIQTSIDFIIIEKKKKKIAKSNNKKPKKQIDEKKVDKKAEPDAKERLLLEIRDLLKNK